MTATDSFLHRLDRVGRGLVPLSLTVLLVLTSVLPFRFAWSVYLLPTLPLMAVYYWAVHRPDLMRPWAVFLVGLLQDVVAGLPIGVHAAVLLVVAGVAGVAVRQRHMIAGGRFSVVWWGLAVVGFGALSLEWAILSLMLGSPLAVTPVVVQYACMLALFPGLSALFAGVRRLMPG